MVRFLQSMQLMLLVHTICTFTLLSSCPVFIGSGLITQTCPLKICMLFSNTEASQLHAPAAICVCMCVCSDLLSGSRTSRLYTRLVETGQAYHANAVPSYPGEKHPNALVLFGQPSSGFSLQTLDKAFQKETQGLIHNGPSAKEMARIKKVGQC